MCMVRSSTSIQPVIYLRYVVLCIHLTMEDHWVPILSYQHTLMYHDVWIYLVVNHTSWKGLPCGQHGGTGPQYITEGEHIRVSILNGKITISYSRRIIAKRDEPESAWHMVFSHPLALCSYWKKLYTNAYIVLVGYLYTHKNVKYRKGLVSPLRIDSTIATRYSPQLWATK